ncbi:MAG: Tic22 family protein [Cyanobacteria bacterium P01_H01_bin.119]
MTVSTCWLRSLGIATAALVGLGTWAVSALSALALTEERVLEILAPVPVFTITNSDGNPLVIPVETSQGVREVTAVFISPQAAEASAEQIRNSAERGPVQVTAASLAELYELDYAQEGQPNDIDFYYVPTDEDLAQAQTLLGSEQTLQGAPLFAVLIEVRDGDEVRRSYLTASEGETQRVPFFFEYETAQAVANDFEQTNADLNATTEIQVLSLDGLITTLRSQTSQTSENSQFFESIILVPSVESSEYLQQQL